MSQLEILRESLGQCDEIILDALLMRNRIVEDNHGFIRSPMIFQPYSRNKRPNRKNGWKKEWKKNVIKLK